MFDHQPSAQSLRDYAEAVASAAPTPGGGSVIANVAALAAGLAEMVCNLTLNRPVNSETQSILLDAKTSAAFLRASFLNLAHADEAAYGGYRAAARLPKTTDDERLTRQLALEAALSASASVPLQIARGCLDLLEMLKIVGTYGTKHALADAHTSRRFCLAALENSLDMAAANTLLMKDRLEAHRLDDQSEELRQLGLASNHQVEDLLADRMS